MKNINIDKIAQIITIIVMFMMVLSPFTAFAQFTLPSSGGTGLPNAFSGCTNFTTCTLAVINILLAVAGLIAVLVLIIAGFRYVTSFGNEEAVGGAKKMIINALIGIVVIILSFVIVRVISNIALRPNTI